MTAVANTTGDKAAQDGEPWSASATIQAHSDTGPIFTTPTVAARALAVKTLNRSACVRARPPSQGSHWRDKRIHVSRPCGQCQAL